MRKNELSIEQKKADKDLNIIIYATLISLIVYLIFGNSYGVPLRMIEFTF